MSRTRLALLIAGILLVVSGVGAVGSAALLDGDVSTDDLAAPAITTASWPTAA